MLKRFVFAISLFLIPCWAQETSEITGRITDASGSVVPGADVHIVQVSNGVKWDVQTNADGYYTQALLPPSSYRVTVTFTGFKQEARNVTLEMEQVGRLDFMLQVGSQTETIEVMATAPLLESNNASIGQVVETQAIADLPLNGRNYLDLAKLSIGTTEPSGIGSSGTTGDRAKNGGAFIANGTRSDQNNFILDGIDNNAKIADLSNNTNVVIQPSVDALGEFKVETNTYSPEYGHSAGAVLSATTKTGTNSIHGSAFEFLRNDAVDARNFFLAQGTPKQELRQSQYGATLGGPIIKNKTFIFGSWQGTRQNSGTTIVETLASSANIAGNFSSLLPKTAINDPLLTVPNPTGTGFIKTPFPGNIIPASRFAETSAKINPYIPAQNVPGPANNYVVSPVTVTDRDAYDLRGDQSFSNADKLFVRYSYYKLFVNNPGPLPAPLIGSSNFQQSINNQSGHQAALGETHVFGASVVNDFRAGYNRISNALRPFVSTDIDSEFGIGYIPPHPGMTGLTTIAITGYSNLGEAGFLPDAKGSDTFQMNDSVLWSKGKHYIKVGGEYRWVRSRFDIDGNARGSFTFTSAFTGNAFADYLLGDPNSATINSELVGDLRYKYYGAYINDDWKITPKLTLNLGIRYELETPSYERNNLQSNFIVGPNVLIFPNNNIPATTLIPASLAGTIPSGVDPRALMSTHKNNWAPRAGFAYQITPNTVIRVGGGLFYAEADANGASSRPVSNPPFKTTYSYTSDGVHPTLTFATGFPATSENPVFFNAGTSSLISWNPEAAVPVIYKWSANLQQQVGKFLIDAGYVGTKGTHLAVTYNINQDYPGAGSTASRYPYQGFNTINYMDSMGNSEYEALQVRVQRRYSNGMSLLVSYTWNKSIDLGSGNLIGDLAIRNVDDVGWERAVSSGSVPQRFVTSYTYALPAGHGKQFNPKNRIVAGVIGDWQLNGITTIRAGQPFTATTSVSSANTGTARPNWNPSGGTQGFQPSVNDWFDLTAFSLQTQYNYGNAGRDILHGPGAINFDASVFKRFNVPKLGENGQIQVRFEGFNIFNHPNFGTPNGNISVAQAGTITTLTTSMRVFQAGLKIVF
jgi:hypothetical protein